MLLSAYATCAGKWTIVAIAIFGWSCCAIPAIVRVAGNPDLSLAARRQVIALTLVCVLSLVVIIALISFDDEGAASVQRDASTDARILTGC